MTKQDLVQQAESFSVRIEELRREISKVIVGQEEVINALLNGLFSHGHVLMIGVPGLAKTLLVKTLAEALDLNFNRVQFTPDLMPSDIIGSEILGEDRSFQFVKGPLFTNLLLADEINRTPPKTQSALLEAMQERQVTAAGKNYRLPDPFFVLATQNPIEQEGTYPLPEAQLDRFMYQVNLDYPSFKEEVQILKQTTTGFSPSVSAVMKAEEVSTFQNVVREVPVPDSVFEYVVGLVNKSRPASENKEAQTYIAYGAGPRAGQNLVLGAKCHALMNGKFSVDKEDVQSVAKWVLSHRVVLNFKAEAEGVKIQEIIQNWI
ncbi:MoxR family ATPase [Bacteroidia bacterium]|jgi:MoxR-like ATPase|nr:MoxR family ATPase [Bacteroidia bacterium]MDA8629022.1 MoxR family ATPase [Bacteroidia bacterium]MDA9213700.1 MoxR family ATPase [Bacteroidia bacterium]